MIFFSASKFPISSLFIYFHGPYTTMMSTTLFID